MDSILNTKVSYFRNFFMGKMGNAIKDTFYLMNGFVLRVSLNPLMTKDNPC